MDEIRMTVDPEQGLSSQQVQQRLDRGLGNQTSNSQDTTVGQIILKHCLTFFNLVFIVLAVVLLLCGSSIKNMTFLVVVVVNTVIGCFQQIRAKKAVDKLTLVAAQSVTVIRDGKRMTVPSHELVQDDIVEFGPGDQICADGVQVTGYLQVNESLITGEADAIHKRAGDELKSGSFVITGRGRVRLTHVGDQAFAARLAQEAKRNPHAAKSEMMRSLDKLIRFIGFALIPIGLVLFYQEYQVLKLSVRDSAEAVVAALVGMVPEGLYLLTSIALAASALKLTRQKVLVQDMNCIETLARVDVLCVDKTGTITEPVMEVEDVLPLTEDPPELLEAALTALYSQQEPENDTARAIRQMFGGNVDWACTRYMPFTSQTKWIGGEFEGQGSYMAGAPEFILGERFEEYKEQIEPWQGRGYRVLLVARYEDALPEKKTEPSLVTPMALILLTNRIRPEAPETFSYFAQQGVQIKVISGDNAQTVSEVARRAGIQKAEKYVDATTLDTQEKLEQAAEEYTVFGRVTPDQKKALILAMKAKGHTVAMTGDGVNDVLALKQADCSIAMASGAQAASQVSQLVLLNNDFSAMPGILGEGRRVINNIQRAVSLFLVKNIFSLALSLISLFTNWPYPLAPLHLSVISGLTIGIPSFFLAMEPNYERVSGSFFSGVFYRALPGGLTNIFVVLMAQAFMDIFNLPLAQVQTVCTAILAVVGLLVLFQVCKPFDKFRKFIWILCAAALLICFNFFGSLFDLRSGGSDTKLVMVTLLIMTPTVFFAWQRLMAWVERLVKKYRKKE